MATDKSTLETALKRFKLGDDAEHGQRQRELAGLLFFSGEQWPDYIKAARNGQTVGNETLGKKPCLTINKIKQPVQQIVNQEKNANLGILLRAEKEASVADAKIRQGLIRHIQAHSRARIARGWAYDRTAQVGRGYYRIDKQYVHKTRKVLEADPASLMDQELIVSRILNQGNVMLDPFAKQPDWSDGNWAFVWDDMAVDEFKRKYKGTKVARLLDNGSAGSEELTATAEQAPGWIGGDDAAKTVRVAEYWYASYSPTTVRVMLLPDGSSTLTDQAMKDWPDGATAGSGELEIEDRAIHWCKITAKDVLEETDWEGSHIPIIPVIGNEYNLNGKRMWNGEIEDAMDAQRLFNYTASAIAMATAIAPLSPYLLDPLQIQGYESWWKQSNLRAFPYLPRHSFDERGQQYPDVRRENAEPPIQALALLLNQADSYIQATTSTPDTSLGRFDPKKASGKAIDALTKQSDLANSNYLDNLAHISMSLEGTILNEMLEYVYDRPGRIVQILGETNEPEQVMLNQPFIKNQQGQPQAAPEPAMGPDVQTYDLSKGTFSIVVDVIKSEPTQRAETQQNIIDMMGTSPQVSSALAPYLFKYSDMAGSDEMYKTLSKLLWPPDMLTKPGEVNWQAQAQQAAQQIQQMSQILEQQQKIIDAKQIEGQTDVMIAKINADAGIERAKIAAASAGQVAITKVNADMAEAVLKMEVDDVHQRHDHAHEAIQGTLDRRQEAAQSDADRAHEAAQTDQQQAHEREMTAAQLDQQEKDRASSEKQAKAKESEA